MLLHYYLRQVSRKHYDFLYSAFIHRKITQEFQYSEEDGKNRGLKYIKLSPSSVLLLSFQDLRLLKEWTLQRLNSSKWQQALKKPCLFECFTSSSSSSQVLFWSYYRSIPKHSPALGLPSLQTCRSAGTRTSYSHSLLESCRCYCNISNKWDPVSRQFVFQKRRHKNRNNNKNPKTQPNSTKI